MNLSNRRPFSLHSGPLSCIVTSLLFLPGVNGKVNDKVIIGSVAGGFVVFITPVIILFLCSLRRKRARVMTQEQTLEDQRHTENMAMDIGAKLNAIRAVGAPTPARK
ncbi:hypothetical protein BKA70DRAFT_1300566 [Coprinopsis sp. MPI-PUGE-AT-0042]|nr:hypothetical protein BKA70DRAFT_1300566 [Coprinopsis sp. MPI-PUGE-AT-0042]